MRDLTHLANGSGMNRQGKTRSSVTLDTGAVREITHPTARFKIEDMKMVKHGGDERSKSDNLTNKIDSPGKKYRDEDDD